jgi:hypothetical protein
MLYWRRVPCSWNEIVGASIAGMSVSHAAARGVFAGITRSRTRFEITDKGLNKRRRSPIRTYGAIWEELLLALLLACAAATFALVGPPSQRYWIAILVLQALPYVATIFCAWLSSRPSVPVVSRAGGYAEMRRKY